jgi:hypothetical protein
MAESWFRFSLHDQRILAPLTAEKAAELRGRGLVLEPASEPDDLAERLAPVVRLLLSPRISRSC